MANLSTRYQPMIQRVGLTLLGPARYIALQLRTLLFSPKGEKQTSVRVKDWQVGTLSTIGKQASN